jgi:hypothetical protein
MAVSLIATIQRFQGISTDAKPTAPPEGSTFHSVDTGEEWVFFDGAWELDLRLTTALGRA